MIFPRTLSETLLDLPRTESLPLASPFYSGRGGSGVVLGVASMQHHMTDEGWQLQNALGTAGYQLCGRDLTLDSVDVYSILDKTEPGIVVLQDKREWDVRDGDFRDARAKFQNIDHLRLREDVFKLTVLKDAHQNPRYHRSSAQEIACHGWIVYYHPKIVKHLAPYVREDHLVRTYHTLDKSLVPEFCKNRDGVFLSGAVSNAYPLRQFLVNNYQSLYKTDYLKHPGYHRSGCHTPKYLQTLSHYKVAICTSSRYGYALRKIIEATACGCVVVTDLPVEEVLPEIDSNLIRIYPSITIPDLNTILEEACEQYDQDRQEELAVKASQRYDFRTEGAILSKKIEELRCCYNKQSL